MTAEALLEMPVTGERQRYGAAGGRYTVAATSAETRNTLFALEVAEPPGGGPPLHLHTREEEFFFVLEGEITFWVDGRVITAGPGGTAFVPRNVPHCFKNLTNDVARVLVVFTPGDIEGFFDYGRPRGAEVPTDEAIVNDILRLAPVYGTEILGPSPL
jgi:quercetin dioxygenase-like cupin family protein